MLPLLGYLSGSLPFAVWITRLVKGVDVRDAGSGHATTTNTIRQAGFGPGAVVLVLDLAKGFLPVWLALRWEAPPWVVALTGAAAVAGHCWPVFAQLRGGMGLAAAGGAYLAVYPLGFAAALAILIALTLLMKHGARASVVMAVMTPMVFYVLHLPGTLVWLAAAQGIVLAARFAQDWRRQYRELWLDREKPAP